MRRSVDLPREPTAPAQARQLLSEWFGDELDEDELGEAKLIVSELIANAYLHGLGQICLRAELDKDRLQLEVIDEGKGFEYTVRRLSFEELSGRGLAIVDAVASRWGVHEGTTHVWAELERSGPRVGREAKP